MALNRNRNTVRVLVKRKDRKALQAVLSANPCITVEELLGQLPRMRWGQVFFLLKACLEEGLVTWSRKEGQLEIRAIHPSRTEDGPCLSGREEFPLTRLKHKDSHLTHS